MKCSFLVHEAAAENPAAADVTEQLSMVAAQSHVHAACMLALCVLAAYKLQLLVQLLHKLFETVSPPACNMS
jgi:hypothetical protein